MISRAFVGRGGACWRLPCLPLFHEYVCNINFTSEAGSALPCIRVQITVGGAPSV